MQKDAELFGRIFESSGNTKRGRAAMVEELVEALMTLHHDEAQVCGVVYQNLERLKLVENARNATRTIQTKGVTSFPELDPMLTWIAISAINAVVHSMSQLSKANRQWEFVSLVRNILFQLLGS